MEERMEKLLRDGWMPEGPTSYVKEVGKRRVIFEFAGNATMTELMICYAERKASLRY